MKGLLTLPERWRHTDLVISGRVTFLVHGLMASFTRGVLEQVADKMLSNIDYSAVGKIAAIFSTAPSTESVSETKPTGKPVEVAEDLIDILTMNINQTVGNSLSDFVVLRPVSLVAVLERAAQRADVRGHREPNRRLCAAIRWNRLWSVPAA